MDQQPKGSADEIAQERPQSSKVEGSPLVDSGFEECEPEPKENLPKKNALRRELSCIMHACGDDANPNPESVRLMEDLVHKFLEDTCREAMDVERSGRLSIESIKYLFRHDKPKFDRLRELMEEKDNLKRLRGAFDSEDGK